MRPKFCKGYPTILKIGLQNGKNPLGQWQVISYCKFYERKLSIYLLIRKKIRKSATGTDFDFPHLHNTKTNISDTKKRYSFFEKGCPTKLHATMLKGIVGNGVHGP